MNKEKSNKEKSFERLTKEQWIEVAQSLFASCETLCAGLQKVKDANPEVTNTAFDPDVYAANISFAVAAIAYVAEYAADKCLFNAILSKETDSIQ